MPPRRSADNGGSGGSGFCERRQPAVPGGVLFGADGNSGAPG